MKWMMPNLYHAAVVPLFPIIVGLKLLSLSLWSAEEAPPIPHPDLSNAAPEVREHIEAEKTLWSEAIHAMDLTPSSEAIAYGKLARVYHAYEYDDAAEACYQRADSLAPNVYPRLYLWGLVAVGRGDLNEAWKRFDAAMFLLKKQDEPPPLIFAAILTQAGDLALKLGRTGEAGRHFQSALELVPQYSLAWFGLGATALQLGDDLMAVSCFERVLAAQPNSQRVYDALLPIHRRMGNESRIRELEGHLAQMDSMTKGIRSIDPIYDQFVSPLNRSVSHRVRLANELIDGGQLTGAKLVLQELIESFPDHPELLRVQGRIAFHEEDWTNARAKYTKVLSNIAGTWEDWLNLGLIDLNTGRFTDSLAWFERCTAKHTDLLLGYYWKAAALSHLGHYQDALTAFERCLELNRMNDRAWVGKARMLYRLNKEEDAKATLEEALTTLPESNLIRLYLGQLLASASRVISRDGSRALDLLEPLYQARSSVTRGIAYAMALAETGKYEKAAEIQTQTLAMAREFSRPAAEQTLEANLSLYRLEKPCREPWPEWDVYPILSHVSSKESANAADE